MIIKKFTASTEKEAIVLAQNELGKDAIVMNVKTMAPKGIYRFFKKTVVEVTAAIDDSKMNPGKKHEHPEDSFAKEIERAGAKVSANDSTDINRGFFANDVKSMNGLEYSKIEEESAIEKKLNNLQKLIEHQMKEKEENEKEENEKDPEDAKESAKEDRNLECIRLIYNKLIENEVDEKLANQIVSDFEAKGKKEGALDNILSGIYQKIVLKLGQQKVIQINEGKTKFVFFIGPTGVGKTTTIAKIASDFQLRKKAKVGLITADTYRVAAVEQLRTYANILGIPLKVIYTVEEMEEAEEFFQGYDLVLIDTAGRSHKNTQQKDDINRLIESIPEEDRDVYLVLSATTKYKDLLKITECYHEITDYGLIFTKLDETSCVGNIYNIKLLTDAPLSYVTYGQNVPDDITQINPQEIAKQILGGCD